MGYIRKYDALAEFFQDADHVDIKTIDGEKSLRGFISGMLSYYPWWIAALYRIREILVRILGLVKHESPGAPIHFRAEALPFEPGEDISFFTISKAIEDTYWVAKAPEDKHLTAALGVVAEKLAGDKTRFHVFTTVKYLHWTGPVYFNLIRPFHHLVVWRMMEAGIKQ
ncbi:MAG: DUF2867 domain-containing protein [Pseudomonadota bacterium]